MRVILTEEDLTTSFNTPFIVEKLQGLQFEGRPLHFQNTEMRLEDDGSLRITSVVGVGEEEPVVLEMKASIEVRERKEIRFVNVTHAGNEASRALGEALIGHVNRLMDLDKFALDGTRLRVDRFRVKNKQLHFYGTAEIDRFPQRNALKK
jgi:hypothetical protein